VSCDRCALHKTALNICIGGRGGGKTMFCGMNPGAEENFAGRAFIGKSGAQLYRMLAAAGYAREDVRVTNAVRCALPAKAPMRPEFIDACRDHLKAEIHRMRPERIVALGDVALRSLCKTSGVTGKRGSSRPLHPDFEYPCEVWITLHPAHVLRNPILEAGVVADLRRMRAGLAQPEEIAFTYYDGSPMRGRVRALDFETDEETGAITQVQVCNEYEDVVVDYEDPIATTRSLCRGPGIVLVGHFSWTFDVQWAREQGCWLPYGLDTSVYAYLDDETQPLGLEACAVRYLGVQGWKEDRDAELGSHRFAAYGARDALYTYRLWRHLDNANSRRIIRHIIRPARRALDACTERGLWINPRAVAAAKAHYAGERDMLLGMIRGMVGDPAFNPRSNPSVAAALIAEGHLLRVATKGGAPSVAKGILANLPQTPLVAALRGHSEAAHMISSFVTPYERATKRPDGRIHAEYTLTRTDTGRTSARNARLGRFKGLGTSTQNLPREERLRRMLSAPPGFMRISVDYAQIEFRFAIWLAGEAQILEQWDKNPDWDAHRWFAAQFYQLEEDLIDKGQRQIAKSGNFSQLYMGTGRTVVDYAAKQNPPVIISPREGAELHQAWHRALPSFYRMYEETWAELKATGMVRTVTGRARHFGDVGILVSSSARGEVLRQAVNMKVQGPCCDLALIALAACHREGLPVTDFWHDSIGFEFLAGDYTKSMERRITRLMVDEPKRVLREHFGVDLTVPLRLDIKKGSD
jgi:uracil-DNA glycosylase